MAHLIYGPFVEAVFSRPTGQGLLYNHRQMMASDGLPKMIFTTKSNKVVIYGVWSGEFSKESVCYHLLV